MQHYYNSLPIKCHKLIIIHEPKNGKSKIAKQISLDLNIYKSQGRFFYLTFKLTSMITFYPALSIQSNTGFKIAVSRNFRALNNQSL